MLSNASIAEKVADLQIEVYMLHDADCAPMDDAEYDEWEDWIIDQIRKSTYADYLSYDVADRLDEMNCHMAASAVYRVVSESCHCS